MNGTKTDFLPVSRWSHQLKSLIFADAGLMPCEVIPRFKKAQSVFCLLYELSRTMENSWLITAQLNSMTQLVFFFCHKMPVNSASVKIMRHCVCKKSEHVDNDWHQVNSGSLLKLLKQLVIYNPHLKEVFFDSAVWVWFLGTCLWE